MELLLVDLCKDTVLKRPTPARTTTAGAVFDVPTFGLFKTTIRPSYIACARLEMELPFLRRIIYKPVLI